MIIMNSLKEEYPTRIDDMRLHYDLRKLRLKLVILVTIQLQRPRTTDVVF